MMYLSDLIDIRLITQDENGIESSTLLTNIKCKIEEKNKLVINNVGQEVKASIRVIIDGSQNITFNSRIMIKKIGNVNYIMNNKEWKVLSIAEGHLNIIRIKEVWL